MSIQKLLLSQLDVLVKESGQMMKILNEQASKELGIINYYSGRASGLRLAMAMIEAIPGEIVVGNDNELHYGIRDPLDIPEWWGSGGTVSGGAAFE